MDFATYELTLAQRSSVETAEIVGNRCLVYRLRGALKEERLATGVKTLIKSCSVLSHRFVQIDGSLPMLQSPVVEEGLRIIHSGKDDNVTFSIIESMCHASPGFWGRPFG